MKEKKKLVSVAVKLSVLALLVFVAVFFESATKQIISQLAVLSVKSYLPEKGITFVAETESVTTTEVQTETTKSVTTETVVSLADDTLTKVDSDIQKLIKNAQKQGSKDKKDGDIYEYTFTDDGVTDSFGIVKVKNTNKTQIDIESKLKEELVIPEAKDSPSVLLYHTHTTETYQLLDRDFYAQGFLTRSNDENLNMVRVGKAVKQELEKMGINVIHDTSVYDNPYTGAYDRSWDAAEAYLEKYPSIKITIDLHRDAIQDGSGVKTKPTAEINGKKAAQIMIIAGCQEQGNGITDLPGWEDNLTFALKLQQSMETLYPGLTRPVFFCPRSYNMGLTPYSLLVEMGTDANTLDEAVYSGKMLGRALGKVIEESTKQ